MNPSNQFDANGDRSFPILWKDGDRIFCRGQRASAEGKQETVLAVLPASEHPAPATLDRLAHEYGLKDELDEAWAVRPLDLVRERGRTMLVLRDIDSEPLERMLNEPLEPGCFLRLAIGITNALDKAHRRRLVHKDIKPANILVNRTTGQVRLTGFGIASRLPRERPALEPPETIAGTLAYMAPEQTGRMNRSIDARSDLYALGITLFQMLTGSLPFTAVEPMEWVHCHIARRPTPPTERLPTAPATISALIMKLLAKTAEERYQTAAGVERDLRRCLVEWEAHGAIGDFALGQQDTPDRLLVPEKLYGREREVETLLTAFDRVVKSGMPELVLVSGYSGIGKSSIVNELHKELVPTRGLFSAGKFDQYKRNIPYATIAQAFQSLVQQILGKSDVELGQWRGALQEALGSNGQLMVNLVPQLALIIGDQALIPDLSPQDQQGRFQLVFRRFLSVFARPEHPLTLFLDDLQWLDSATLDLIEHLLAHPDVRHLLLIGAYRDNEVGPTHPLARTLAEIRNAHGRVQETMLMPLWADDVARLLADALRTEKSSVRPLADLVFEKTAGNPFFTIQFVATLADEALLAFDPPTTAWTWDLPRIRAKGFTGNVANLMAKKLGRLPPATQGVLKQLACLGNAAKTAALALVYQATEAEIHATLWDAVQSGLVLRSDDAYSFLHDRIREAAYALIPEDERAMTHLQIGRLLAAGTPVDEIEENVFELVNQFDRGAGLIVSQTEREEIARLNLLAGKRAKTATAYDSALRYFSAGRALLAEIGWHSCYRLTFDLELNWAECEYLTGELPSAEERLAALSIHTRNMIDSASVTCARINLYTTLDRSDDAVRVGLEHLRRIDGEWSAHPTTEDVRRGYDRLWQRLGARSIEALVDLPRMWDPDRCATMDVLTVLTSPALFTDLNLFRLIVSRMARLSLEFGNSDGSCLAYVWLGGVLGAHFGQYRAGSRFGRLGLDLIEKHGLDRYSARVYLVFAVHVAHWTQPLQISHAFLGRAFDAALAAGDLSYAAYSCIDVITNLIAAGDLLSEVERVSDHGLEFARKVRFGLASDCIIGQLRLIRMLRGLTQDFNSFNDAEFEESHFERRLNSNPQLAIASCYYWIRKLQARVYANDATSAMAAVSKVEALLWTIPTQFELAEYHFFAALARAAHYDTSSPEERRQHLEALIAHHRQLVLWAEHCPATFANRAALVGSEIARLEGRELDAMRLHEEAIRLSREHGFIQNEGLAHERAARFCATRGFQTIAESYQRSARRCYLSWGAHGKVRQLDELYSHLREDAPALGPTGTIGAPIENLDLATVVKVSQAVSGEIELSKLIETLLRIAVEHAGAERGLLILLAGDEPQIAAEATTGQNQVEVTLSQTPVSPAALPQSVLHTVLRTRESVILDDALAKNLFSADDYISRERARSVLCLPLLKQAKLIGALYLENKLASRVFTPSRISVLKLLTSQAANSLENARLYGDLQEREARIRRLVDSNIVGVLIWDAQGRIIDANQAFLDIVGYDREDLLAGRLLWTKLTPPEWSDTDGRVLAELRAAGSLPPREKEYFRKDGSRVSVLIARALFESKQDEGVSFVVDITERKRAELERQRLASLVEQAADLMAIADLSGGMPIYLNKAGLRMVGLDSWEEAKTRRGIHYIFPEDRQFVNDVLWPTVLEKGSWSGEMRFRHFKTGDPIPILYSAFRIDDPETGQPVNIGNVCRDITDRKLAEEELRASERRLLDAQMELARVTRVTTLGELTASIAHEVNQPLAALVNAAGACLRWLDGDTPNLEEARLAAGWIIKEGNRAADVIRRVRALAKRSDLERAPLDVNDVVREALALVQHELTSRHVSLRLELAPALPSILGDRVQLQQVIINLVMNGLEAMQSVMDRPRALVVQSRRDGAEQVLVSVTDCGIGISPKDADRLFNAFFTTKAGGMGMGLSICRSIIEAHSGRLLAIANQPHGATFQFTIPWQAV
ncbi:AAA family ATPase [Bradyrhizobium sp. th.b2]|uniref:ATP-binding sensor histidine kinase n=1 Tax=Bradyrhizobium sp. th-b2 TaxID=172088 RepID=UPI0003F8E7F9|nr:AAA family ATPase [Bradyrhizobium sp. th.b2]